MKPSHILSPHLDLFSLTRSITFPCPHQKMYTVNIVNRGRPWLIVPSTHFPYGSIFPPEFFLSTKDIHLLLYYQASYGLFNVSLPLISKLRTTTLLRTVKSSKRSSMEKYFKHLSALRFLYPTPPQVLLGIRTTRHNHPSLLMISSSKLMAYSFYCTNNYAIVLKVCMLQTQIYACNPKFRFANPKHKFMASIRCIH